MHFTAGLDNFGVAIRQNLEIVDKSLFIKEILDNRGVAVTVITRPRRFGKTFNLSMLHHFLADEVDQLKTEGLFDHLKIAQAGSEYMDQQGKYPVIFVTLKKMTGPSFDTALDRFRELIQSVYKQFSYLETSTKLDADDKETVAAFATGNVTRQARLESSLEILCRLLHLHHGIKPWLLIDEYDTPTHNGYFHEYYDQVIDFMRGLFGNALKGNNHMHRAVVTGVLRISKENLFSQVNNPKVFSLFDSEYADCFGFTQSEVDEILEKNNLQKCSDEIKHWYNGYQIGGYQIYNPLSIADCVNKQGEMGLYWVNTSGNVLIKKTMAGASAAIKEKFEQLINDKPIAARIMEHMVFGDLKINQDALWSLLLFSGYLTVVKTKPVHAHLDCILKVPNQEVDILFKDMISEWFDAPFGSTEHQELLHDLVTGHLDAFIERFRQYLLASTSYFDFGDKPESFYHGFVLGLMVNLSKTHHVQSNKESGFGRYDIMLVPKNTEQLGLIIEFKVAKKDETLLESAEAALAQINAKNYEVELKQKGIQKILKIGLAFRSKEVEMIAQ